jgi:hypothetical protein
VFLVVGVVASIPIGKFLRRPQGGVGVGTFIGSVLLATAVGIVLTFATVAANFYCIEMLRKRISHGDVNMSYWFHSFYAIPVFWIVALFVAMVPSASDSAQGQHD